MKQGIHPEYTDDERHLRLRQYASRRCPRWKRFTSRSARCAIPFYTGKQRLVDTAGRVDRFKKKYEKADQE